MTRTQPSVSTVVALLFVTFGSMVSRGDDVDVYLLSGQSNMQGSGRVDDLDASFRKPVENTFYWNGTTFELFHPGKTKLSGRDGNFGPEIGFVESLRDAKQTQPIYIIKFYRSGQPLDAGWNGGQWIGDPPGPHRATFYPGTTQDDPNRGRHYQDWMRMCEAAMEVLRGGGHMPVVRGVLWMQGEQDSKNEVSAGRYAASLRDLRRRVSDDLKIDLVPWVFGQVLPHEPALDRFTHRPQIREQMWRLDERSNCDEATDGMRMVSTDHLPLLDDTVHYASAGQIELGRRFASAMAAMQHEPRRATEFAQQAAAANLKIEKGDFHGFLMYQFALNNVPCRVACPKEVAPGTPWVWRARFWGHRPEFDVRMLQQGWHVVYCDVADLYGSDQAIERWNAFYAQLQTFGFHKAPVLEGMSRGGLIVMRWASAHPDQVAGIYVDNAVMNMRSWPGGTLPGGLTSGKGSKGDWEKCLKAYGLTTESVAGFHDGPLDRLTPLANAGVPIYALINQADGVVPPEDNGNLLAAKYRELGGSIIEHRRPDLDHHPHGLDDPAPIVSFAIESMIKAQ
ncbi:MAG: sialate O-acetylesterase [Planctomycetaceae bacterium]